ncbi:hypothetical protein 36 [Diadegma semiclausum ichnovirus]|nr:hypothetical protein 30 [Diadegma semiclausum ichnovirus]AHY22029.1 hypothetical protein 36 [Diadegma semiclausum ichnovirus]
MAASSVYRNIRHVALASLVPRKCRGRHQYMNSSYKYTQLLYLNLVGTFPLLAEEVDIKKRTSFDKQHQKGPVVNSRQQLDTTIQTANPRIGQRDERRIVNKLMTVGCHSELEHLIMLF